ncbi:MAG: hypothetical protein C4346_02675 [Chloroflexota bacterium]
MITPLYDARGRCRGFIAGEDIYNRKGRLVGTTDGRRVFDLRGSLIGEIRGQTIIAMSQGDVARDVRSRPGGILGRIISRLGLAAPPADPFDRLERAS